MDGNELDREFRAGDPVCPPWWRSEDARRRAAGQKPEWSPHGDPAVSEYARFLRAVTKAQARQKPTAVQRKWPAIAIAHQIHEQDNATRWMLEAYVLANLSDAEVAARCGVAEVTADVVQAYVALFIDVRDKLDAKAWLMHHVVGPGWWGGFANDEVRQFWAWCALAGGPLVVDYLARLLREGLGPEEKPCLGAYLKPNVPLPVSAFVADFMIPPSKYGLEFFEELHIRLQLARTIGDVDRYTVERDRLRVETVRVAQAVLAGRPLPKRTWLKRHRDRMQKDRSLTPAAKTGLGPAASLQDFVETMLRSS